MEKVICPICNRNEVSSEPVSGHNYSAIKCQNCGEYKISWKLLKFPINDDMFCEDRHMAAGYLRELFDLGQSFGVIKTDNYMELINNSRIPKTPMQKIEKLLLHYYRINRKIGQKHKYLIPGEIAIGYAIDDTEMINMFKELENLGYFWEGKLVSYEGTSIQLQSYYSFKINIKGHEKAEQLLTNNIDSAKVFVAMQFKNNLKKALEVAIKPACDVYGFSADTVSPHHNIDINDKILSEIRASKFVIVDYTYNNCGAYYEAGFARGIGLEVICCCSKRWLSIKDKNGKKNKLHFDVEHINLILWPDHNYLKEQLIKRIGETISGAEIQN